MNIPVFRKGLWLSYSVPADVESCWTKRMKFQAASLYATAITKGYSAQDAGIYAEMWVNKQLYEGLVYDAKQEDILKSLCV